MTTTTTTDIAPYKLKFNRTLEPIKVMLVQKKSELSREDWLNFVDRTKEGIIRHPDQYLGQDLPPREMVPVIVKIIFADFLSQVA